MLLTASVLNVVLAAAYDWRDQPLMPIEFSVAAYRVGHSMVRNGYQTNEPHRGVGSFAPLFANVPGGRAGQPARPPVTAEAVADGT